jgi:CHRD domain-containing protein
MGNNIRCNIARALAVAGALGLVAGCAEMKSMMPGGESKSMHGENITLSGSNEVPPSGTSASGSGNVAVGDDCSVTAKVHVTGMTGTAAHIHQGASGANGPVIVPFTKTADNTFEAPSGAKMSSEQCAAYKAGNTYVNVHSAAKPGGEVRAQLRGR